MLLPQCFQQSIKAVILLLCLKYFKGVDICITIISGNANLFSRKVSIITIILMHVVRGR